MNRIFKSYKELFQIMFAESPFIVVAVFISAVVSGLVIPVSVWVNSQIFNLGVLVASGGLLFSQFAPYLVLFLF